MLHEDWFWIKPNQGSLSSGYYSTKRRTWDRRATHQMGQVQTNEMLGFPACRIVCTMTSIIIFSALKLVYKCLFIPLFSESVFMEGWGACTELINKKMDGYLLFKVWLLLIAFASYSVKSWLFWSSCFPLPNAVGWFDFLLVITIKNDHIGCQLKGLFCLIRVPSALNMPAQLPLR